MKFIKAPENGIWVAAQDDLTEDTVKKRILDCEVWFSDLDDCDADSPAKKIAKKAISTNHFSPKYLGWCLGTGLALAKKGKESESERWNIYVENFLREEKALFQVEELFNKEEVRESLYPGVKQFYSILSANKYYITRNIQEVAQAYAEVLGFQWVFPEIRDKKDIVEGFILENPGISRYGSSGDSIEDELIVDVLKFYHKKEIIAPSVTLYRADSPTKLNSNFDINVGKDRTGLVEILKS